VFGISTPTNRAELRETSRAERREEPALEIRFGPLDLALVRIRSLEPGAILDELTGRVATAPRFFERAPVGLDLSPLAKPPAADAVHAAIEAVRRAGMLPVGLVSGPPFVEPLARALELPVLPQFRTPSKPPPVLQPAQSAAPEPEFGCALIQHHPVRSGQRVYARHRDLVVTAAVGAGAEVMADGCVHVYGPLRGRAMAGAQGDGTARVFCQEFQAELVSVAGVFRVFETIPADLAGRTVQAWLEGGDLRLARIGA
jgi:septum site-determining protein MinC